MRRCLVGVAVVVLLVGVLAVATPVAAHDYDSGNSGHPLRYLAYLVYPIGYATEFLITRPVHYAVSQPYARVFFGHDPRHEIDEQGNLPVAPIVRPAPAVVECPKCHLPLLKPRDKYWDDRIQGLFK